MCNKYVMTVVKFESLYLKTYLDGVPKKWQISKGGFKSEDTGEYLHCQQKYSKSLSWAENLNFPPKTVNNLFKFYAQDSDLEYLCWQRKIFPVSSDLKPPLGYSFPSSCLFIYERL